MKFMRGLALRLLSLVGLLILGAVTAAHFAGAGLGSSGFWGANPKDYQILIWATALGLLVWLLGLVMTLIFLFTGRRHVLRQRIALDIGLAAYILILTVSLLDGADIQNLDVFLENFALPALAVILPIALADWLATTILNREEDA